MPIKRKLEYSSRISRYLATSIDVAASAFNPKAKRENLNWTRPAHPNAALHNETLRQLYDLALSAVSRLGNEATAETVQAKIEAGPVALSDKRTTPIIPGFMVYTAPYIARRVNPRRPILTASPARRLAVTSMYSRWRTSASRI